MLSFLEKCIFGTAMNGLLNNEKQPRIIFMFFNFLFFYLNKIFDSYFILNLEVHFYLYIYIIISWSISEALTRLILKQSFPIISKSLTNSKFENRLILSCVSISTIIKTLELPREQLFLRVHSNLFVIIICFPF